MAQDDERAFEAFVHALTGPLFRTALLMVGDRRLADDVLHATFASVRRRWHRVGALDDPGAFARSVLVHEALSRRRGWSAQLPLGALDPEEATSVPLSEEPPEELVQAASVWQAVMTLPPRQRAIVVLHVHEDLTEPQIADVLDVAVATVRRSLQAAEQQLGALLGEHAPLGEGCQQ